MNDIFGEPIGNIDVTEDPLYVRAHGEGVKATTRFNSIWVMDCDKFWSNLHDVLHEYYHVTNQWNKDMSLRDYVIEYLKQRKKYKNHKLAYINNKYEKEARNFADIYESVLKDCMENVAMMRPAVFWVTIMTRMKEIN